MGGGGGMAPLAPPVPTPMMYDTNLTLVPFLEHQSVNDRAITTCVILCCVDLTDPDFLLQEMIMIIMLYYT